MVLFLILTIILCWGIWLGFARSVRTVNPQAPLFYAMIGCLITALIFNIVSARSLIFFSDSASIADFLLPMCSGALWVLGGFFAFYAMKYLGQGRALGIWQPINLIVGFLWSIFYLKQLTQLSNQGWMMIALAGIILMLGIYLLALSGEKASIKATALTMFITIASVLLAGLLWGSYFIPGTASKLGDIKGMIPQSIGMVIMAFILAVKNRQTLRLERPIDYLFAMISGALWIIGNTSFLTLGHYIGNGLALATAQPSLALNTLTGIILFREQIWGSKKFWLAMIGSLIVIAGGVMFGFAH